MKPERIAFITVCLCLISPAPVSRASESEAGDDRSREASAAPQQAAERAGTAPAASAPIFVPRSRSAPQARIGGATRSAGSTPPAIEVLAPQSVGLTLESQPVLYWYLPEPTGHRIDLTVLNDASVPPLLETTIEPPKRAGVQRIRLADHDFTLAKGVDYQWYISIARDSESKDIAHVAGGGIVRIDAPAELARDLAAASEADRSYVLAKGGVWYDALDALSRRIDAAPENMQLRALRADLLEQVGLDEVARAERASAAAESERAKSSSVLLPVYSPPKPVRASYPRHLTGLGARGPRAPQPAFRVFALAPNHLGVTIREQPTLYWYLEQDSDIAVDFTLVDGKAANPLLEIAYPPPLRAGVHAVDLAEHGLRLETGITYEWTAALVMDERQVHPTISVGFVERRQPDPDLDRELAEAGAGGAVRVYATRGLWYEAFDDATRRIAASPSDPGLRLQRAALLYQVGLTPLADRERHTANTSP